MTDNDVLPPPYRLALVHADTQISVAWAALLHLDIRLMAIAMKGQESVLRQLRLSWWRDQLAKPVDERPKGEPLIALMSNLPQSFDIDRHAHMLIDAWEGVAVYDEITPPDSIEAFASARSEAIFGSYVQLLNHGPEAVSVAVMAGKYWALNAVMPSLPTGRLKLLPGLKPLNLLSLSALVNRTSGPAKLRAIARLYLHILTGR